MSPRRSALPPTVRSPHARRVNRLTLGLVGLLLAAGGGAGLAAGFGVFGSAVAHRSVLSGAADYADAHRWVWVAVAVAGVLAAVLAVAWLAAQPRTNRIAALDVPDAADPPDSAVPGRTLLAGAAVSDAVGAEVSGYLGVRDASARLVTERGRPVLLVRAALDGRVAPDRVARRIQSGAVHHARRALDAPELPARLEIGLAARPRRLVR